MDKIAKLICEDCGFSTVVNGVKPPSRNVSTAVAMQCPDCGQWNMKLIKSLQLPRLPEEE